MTPPHPNAPRPGRSGQLLGSLLRIQSLVASIVGGTLALAFALGGHFGRVALSLALLAYGLGSLAYATRARAGAPAPSHTASNPHPLPAPPRGSGRVIPFTSSRRPQSEAARDELDQLAGR